MAGKLAACGREAGKIVARCREAGELAGRCREPRVEAGPGSLRPGSKRFFQAEGELVVCGRRAFSMRPGGVGKLAHAAGRRERLWRGGPWALAGELAARCWEAGELAAEKQEISSRHAAGCWKDYGRCRDAGGLVARCREVGEVAAGKQEIFSGGGRACGMLQESFQHAAAGWESLRTRQGGGKACGALPGLGEAGPSGGVCAALPGCRGGACGREAELFFSRHAAGRQERCSVLQGGWSIISTNRVITRLLAPERLSSVSMHRSGGGRGVGVVAGSIGVRQLGLLTLREKEVRVFLS